jgi:hypothetical protein
MADSISFVCDPAAQLQVLALGIMAGAGLAASVALIVNLWRDSGPG